MIIKTAIAGTGRIGFMLEKDTFRYHPCTHAGSLQFLNGGNGGDYRFQLVAACDLQESRLQAFRNWWKEDDAGMRLHTDFRYLLDHTDIDLLIISSSFHSHNEIIARALEKNIKAIVLEKPAVEKIEDIENLLDVSLKKNIPVWVNFERRYHNGYRKIKRIIELQKKDPQQFPGNLRSITGKVLTGPARKDDEGGPLLLDGIHWLDLFIWFFGMPEVLDVKKLAAAVPGMDDTVTAFMEYGGAPVFLEAGGRRRYFEFFMELDFDRGRIRTGNEGQFFYESGLSQRYENFYELGLKDIHVEKNNPWADMYSEVAEYIMNPEKGTVTSPLSDSLKSLRLYYDLINHERKK